MCIAKRAHASQPCFVANVADGPDKHGDPATGAGTARVHGNGVLLVPDPGVSVHHKAKVQKISVQRWKGSTSGGLEAAASAAAAVL